MIQFTSKDDSIIFNVRVVPRASKSEIVGEHGGALKIRISAPPVDGAANTELIKVLAKEFGVSKSSVEIIGGQTSKTKQIKIHKSEPSATAEGLSRHLKSLSTLDVQIFKRF